MLRRLALALVLLPCVAAPVSAEPALWLPHVQQDWNYLTDDAERTTSRCIGTPETPLCAVETLLACFQRSDRALCAKVDETVEQYQQVFEQEQTKNHYLAYRVMAVQMVGDGAPPPHHADAQFGDILLTLDQREGVIGSATPTRSGTPSDFLLRKRDSGSWRVVNWGDLDEDTPAQTTENNHPILNSP